MIIRKVKYFLVLLLLLISAMFNNTIEPLIQTRLAAGQLESTAQGYFWFHLYLSAKPYLVTIIIAASFFLLYDDLANLYKKIKNNIKEM